MVILLLYYTVRSYPNRIINNTPTKHLVGFPTYQHIRRLLSSSVNRTVSYPVRRLHSSSALSSSVISQLLSSWISQFVYYLLGRLSSSFVSWDRIFKYLLKQLASYSIRHFHSFSVFHLLSSSISQLIGFLVRRLSRSSVSQFAGLWKSDSQLFSYSLSSSFTVFHFVN